MNPINIIGAGMAGSILAKLFRKEGIEYRIFDCKMPGAASQISENLIGVNWYKNMKTEVRDALEILKSIVPVRVIQAGTQTAHHVYTQDLLETNFINAEMKLFPGGAMDVNTGEEYTGFNIVCAGVWSKLLDQSIDVDEIVGHGLIYPGATPIEQIKPYKPFRFEKLINRNPWQTWFSNSLSVSARTYQANREKYTDELFEAAAKNPNLLGRGAGEYRHGYRPFTSSHNNLMIPGGMVITGGYKSGMLYYPLQCKQAVEWVKNQAEFL